MSNPTTITFSSQQGLKCEALWYRPETNTTQTSSGSLPCVVMAPGLGAVKEGGLDQYAEQFVNEGLAVLLFDYRYFGGSEGTPRQLLDISSQLTDWHQAVAFARSQNEVDANKIILWGTSFSGGHVLSIAAEDRRVLGVIAQCPMLDGEATAKVTIKETGLASALKLVAHGVYDEFKSKFSSDPHYVPIVAKPGELGMMTTEDADPGYRALMPAEFDNRVAARIAVHSSQYRPVDQVHRIQSPVMLQICDHERIVSIDTAGEIVRRMQAPIEVKHYPLGHFDIYQGQAFQQSISDQKQFIQQLLQMDAH